MQDCHWQEALSMITWVTEDLCVSAQRSRQGQFSSLALHLCKLDMGYKPKRIYLSVSFYFCQAFMNPLHFNTSGWRRSDSSPAVPTHHQWVWVKNYTFHSKANGLRSSEAQVAAYKAIGPCQELLPVLKKCIKWILLFRTSCPPPLRSIERSSGIREE